MHDAPSYTLKALRHPCSAARGVTRASASQVTGDPNVPAGKVTLFTVDEPPTLGRYDGFEHNADGAAQPDRPVGECFLGHGVPGVCQPCATSSAPGGN